MTNMKKYIYAAMSVMLVLCLVVSAGCGGGKKKKSADSVGSPEGTLTGKVDLFSGFGPDAGRGARFKALKEGGALVRLYRLQTGGSGLSPVSDVQPQPLSGDSFKLEKVPLGERNLVVRVEKGEGEAILSAVAPPVSAAGSFVVISPETDIEAALVEKLVAEGVAEPDDIRPANVDASLIKDIVRPGLFFDVQVLLERDEMAAALLPAVRQAYVKLAENLFGQGAKVDHEELTALVSQMAEPMMAVRIKEDRHQKSGAREKKLMADSLAKALAETPLSAETLSPESIWWLAEAKARMAAARALVTPGEGALPAPDNKSNGLVTYGKLLGDAVIEDLWNEDMEDRSEKMFPQNSATGTRRLPPVATVEKLMNLPGGVVEPFRAAARATANPQNIKPVFYNLRDVLLTGALGMSYPDAERIYSSAHKESRALALAVADPNMPPAQTARTHREFIAAQDTVFQPLCSAVRTRFSRLEDTDTKKLCRALSEIILLTTLYDVPAKMFYSRDTDGDRVPDNVEAALGTEPGDKDSSPAEVLTATPASMLPPRPSDADSDGYFDSVELIAGTDPESASSKPAPGKIKFCAQPGPVCFIPGGEPGAAGYTISGTVVYSGTLVSGVTVGVYSDPDFISGRPAAVSSRPTGMDGVFTVNAPDRKPYFVAAFTDTDGNGAPGSGEAVGYLGGDYPSRVKHDSRGAVSLEMIGVMGASKCGDGKFNNPVTGECVGECPDGFNPNPLTGECVCGGAKMFVEPKGTCAAECPKGTAHNALRGGCFCPAGTLADRKAGTCACPDGMFLDDSLNTCRCRSGYLEKRTMTCMDKCPETFTANDETGACECPEGASAGEAGARCECATGIFNPVDAKCAAACPYGMKPGAGGVCACVENETFDAVNKKCSCVPGMERTAQGNCADPSLARPSRDTREQLDDMPQNRQELDKLERERMEREERESGKTGHTLLDAMEETENPTGDPGAISPPDAGGE